ncbi:hypothetical protein U91I_01061 [alpha proteobacterium U9-1i]|nr:hypothetical protein U91I_01061 [alpha proteobacterium U9-1i]
MSRQEARLNPPLTLRRIASPLLNSLLFPAPRRGIAQACA